MSWTVGQKLAFALADASPALLWKVFGLAEQ